MIILVISVWDNMLGAYNNVLKCSCNLIGTKKTIEKCLWEKKHRCNCLLQGC